MSKATATARTVHSTTGTAPIELRPGQRPGTVYVFTEDGAGQVYPVEALLDALRAVAPEAVSA